MSNSHYKYARVLRLIEDELLPSMNPGDVLPPTEELCARAGVSSITVNRALRILSDARRIRRVRNKGSVVLSPPASPAKEASHSAPAASTSEAPLRILGIHSNIWNFMKVIEGALDNFQNYQGARSFRYQIDYQSPDAHWCEKLAKERYDLVLVNSFLMHEVISTPSLAARFQSIDALPGLHFGLDDFHPAAAHECQRNGRWHTVPLITGPMLQVINPRYPKLSSLPAEHLGSWANYWNRLGSLRQTGRPMLFIDMSISYLEALLRQEGLSLFTADGQHCLMDSPQVVAFMKELNALCVDQKLILPATSRSAGETAGSLEVIHQAIGIRWASMLNFSAQTPDAWHVAPLPSGKSPFSHLFMEGIMVGRSAPHKPVVDFLNYLQSAAVQTRFTGCSGLSSRKDMLPLQLAALEPKYNGLSQAFHQAMSHAHSCLPFARTAAIDIVQEYMILICNGLVAPADGCRAAAAKANAVLQQSAWVQEVSL